MATHGGQEAPSVPHTSSLSFAVVLMATRMSLEHRSQHSAPARKRALGVVGA